MQCSGKDEHHEGKYGAAKWGECDEGAVLACVIWEGFSKEMLIEGAQQRYRAVTPEAMCPMGRGAGYLICVHL